MPPGKVRVVPQRQKSKGSLIVTAALELSTNPMTHFYSEKKNTAEMIKLLEVLLEKYRWCHRAIERADDCGPLRTERPER